MATSIGKAAIDLTVNSQQAVRGLKAVSNELKSVEKTTKVTDAAFGRLKTAIAGFATLSTLKYIQDLNSSIVNMSRATGISAAAISAFSQAMVTSGGTADRARDAISDLTKNIGGAVGGSAELQRAFQDVGISLSDLATLSTQDIFAKTLQGLATMPDAAVRSSTAMKILGESVKGVDLDNLNRQFGITQSQIGPYASSIQAAADAQTAIAQNLQNLTTALTKVLEPLNQLIASTTISVQTFETMIRVIGGLATAYLALGPGLKNLGKLGNEVAKAFKEKAAAGVKTRGVFQSLKAAILGIPAGLKSFTLNLMRAGGALDSAYGGVTSLKFAFIGLGKAVLRFAGIFGLVYSAVTVVNDLIKGITGFDALETLGRKLGEGWDWAKEKIFGYKKEVEDQSAAETKRLEENAKRLQEKDDRWAAINQRLKEHKAGLDETIKSYKEGVTAANEQLQLQTAMVGMPLRQRAMVEALAEAERNYLTEKKKLESELAKLSASRLEEDKLKAAQVSAAIQTLNKAYADNTQEIIKNTDAKTDADEADQKRLFRINEEIRAQDALKKIKREIADAVLTDTEKKYRDIERAAADSAEAAIRAEEARRGEKLNASEIKEYYRVAEESVDGLIKKQKELDAVTRDWNTGWTKAMKSYVETATNGAQAAENIFKKATQGMEDAIVNFAKTGKFEFKSFVNSIVEELLRSQVRQLIAKTFGGIGGGGGNIFSGLGSILGFANGGRIPTNNPVLVGENGPELISGAAGRTVIPNHQLGGGSVTYNINAVDAQSFKQMVARDPAFLYAVTEQGRRTIPGAA